MSRDIKFRAWDKDCKKILPWEMMVTGFLQGFLSKKYNVEVMQFSGLHDKNGKEIYEGDIINLINCEGDSINVVCELGTARRSVTNCIVDITGFYFKLPNGKKSFPVVNNYLGKHDLEIFEIIGNIYENPELLEDTKC